MKTLWFPLALLLIAVPARWGAAQRPGAVLLNDGLLAQEQMEAAAQWYRTGLQQYLAIRIEEIRRVCHLTEPQAKKLEVAAKGAVEQVMRKRRDAQQNQVLRFQANFEPPVAAIAAPPVAADPVKRVPKKAAEKLFKKRAEEAAKKAAKDEAKQAAEAAKRAVEELAKRAAAAAKRAVEEVARRAVNAPDPPPPPIEALIVPAPPQVPAPAVWMPHMQARPLDTHRFAAVAKEPVWTKTVETLLTEEQKNALRAATDQRAAFQHQAVVNQIVANEQLQ